MSDFELQPFEPMFDILERPDDVLAEIFIRRRHSDGSPIPEDEHRVLADRFYSRMQTSEWMDTFGDILLEENRRRGNI